MVSGGTLARNALSSLFGVMLAALIGTMLLGAYPAWAQESTTRGTAAQALFQYARADDAKGEKPPQNKNAWTTWRRWNRR